MRNYMNYQTFNIEFVIKEVIEKKEVSTKLGSK